jgi:hypothetical protein
LRDQAVVAEQLGRDSVPADQLPELISQLVNRPTLAQLITEARRVCSVPLREVTIARYVRRLRLEGTIPEPVFRLITQLLPVADRPLLKAIARRRFWEKDTRLDILSHYFTSAINLGEYRVGDTVALLKLAETYEPQDLRELRARLPHWQQVLQQEINAAGGAKPFFNERVEELHGGGRDQRRQDNTRLTARENELAFLQRLQRVLAA